MIDQVNKDILSFLFKGEIPREIHNIIRSVNLQKNRMLNTSKEEIPNMDELSARNRAAGIINQQ